ncbi:molybdopterin-dependent oxidoreductase [Dehalococcoidia bacterium]|nr:molybdopterin-dependent oxidoreductase [Dehalococcoidia bacterium]
MDPRKTTPASRADVWLKPRPGSDGILALGMIKVIIEEQLYDEGFVSSWMVGFDRLAEHVETYCLKDVEEVTWIPQERIREVARLYAETRPATIEWGNALDHTEKSFQTCRAICILRALTGNLDVAGGEILTTPVPLSRSGQFMLLRQFPRKPERMAGSEFKLAARSAFIARQSLVKAILDEQPYPVKAALLFGTNPLLSYPDAARTYQALMKLELMVVADLFMTPTASLADVVLPVASIGESDEIGPYPAAGGIILAYPKIVEPPGECWPDIKIINQLGSKLGLEDHFWADEREALDFILEPSGLTFEDLKERRYLEGEEYPLLLTNAKERHFSHSAHRNIARLREMTPDPVVELNPATARRLGVEEGSWVFIETPKGKIKQKLLLDEALDPRVVVASYGWWFPEKGASELFDWRKSNINIITDSAPPYDPAFGSLNLRGIPCRVVGDLADRMP